MMKSDLIEGAVLIIEDDEDDLKELAEPLERMGHIRHVLRALDKEQAVAHVGQLNEVVDAKQPALIVLDLSVAEPESDLPDLPPNLKPLPAMSDFGGLQILQLMRNNGLRSEIPVLIRSYHYAQLQRDDYPDIWEHYRIKDYALKDEVGDGFDGDPIVKTLMQISRLMWRTRLPSGYVSVDADFEWMNLIPLIGSEDLLDRIALKIGDADPNKSILICGDAGTGKWVAAAAVHLATWAASLNRQRAFREFDCSKYQSDHPLEDIFFSLTTQDKDATIDWTTEFDLILRKFHTLDARRQSQFARLASNGAGPAGVVNIKRVIFLGNGPLSQFCPDVLRACPLIIELPALDPKREDIELFTNFFLKRFHERAKPEAERKGACGELHDVPSLDDEAMQSLIARQWQRNRGELLDVIARAYRAWRRENRKGKIGVRHLP